ncbi:MAG: hypothetical protein DRZ76_01080 [Candidatus Nealsonbacteria bacterium]|nr:MAG: hypothetical protein DRZ76_01080 [Candidatus Nealsonbacteria bacterium]
MNIRTGEKVAARDGRELIVGPVVLIETDFVAIRVKSGETRNVNLKNVFPINFLINYYLRGRSDNSHYEKELKGVIKYLLTRKIFPGFQRKALKKLRGIPEVGEKEILRIL